MSSKWIIGANSVRIGNICDHSLNDQHAHTMSLLKQKCAASASSGPQSATAQGLLEVEECGVLDPSISKISDEQCKKLIGIEIDGVSTSVATSGRKVWLNSTYAGYFGCGTQLALKNTLRTTAFYSIYDLFLKLYYLQEKSSTKCLELEDVIMDVKECFSVGDRVKLVHASGSRWVGHKLNAMKQMKHVISKLGSYTSHIVTLYMGRYIKSADCAKHKRNTQRPNTFQAAIYLLIL